jgi:glucosamine-6-phosphate deaminase
MSGSFTQVEQAFFERTGQAPPTTAVPYIVVENFPQLGFFTALRFLEWVADHPEGVVSLPTGKTPEYFIKWVQHLLANWSDRSLTTLRHSHGLDLERKPELRGLQFVQIDEFYPIDPDQHNSFYHYVRTYYIDGFGLDPQRAQFINCADLPRAGDRSLREIFPDSRVDLTLRYREVRTDLERLQQETIFLVDQWCTEYEEQIRAKGGIGFFLGGIGPDGHIAFNVRGSDLNSTTRLTATNFETQAAAAVDLGGIEISRHRLVITIGLATITHNPEAVAIIFAAGEAKSEIVRRSLEHPPDVRYPATVLQRLPHSRFYLTRGAAGRLREQVQQYYTREHWEPEKTQRAVIDLCRRLHKYGHHLTLEDLQADPYCSQIPDLGSETVPTVIAALKQKLEKGLMAEEEQRFLHTGPHHDDIMLGFLPHIIHLVRSPHNRHRFAVMTSGFTSVTNAYVIRVLEKTRSFLSQGRIEMTDYPDFFARGYRYKWDKDVYHYLDRLAAHNREGCARGLSHRVVRALVDIYALSDKAALARKIDEVIDYLRGCYDGEKNPPDIQRLKGMIREFEEELVWAHYGVRVEDVSHLRLGFYTGDIFTEPPDRSRDVPPLLELLRQEQPTVITLALDPEGSGPDTHYKVLQTIAEALRIWRRETDLSALRLWGYRNVWYRFHPAEADIIVPVSLNSMAVLQDTFLNCYLSQKDASFPSHELDGPFSELTQKIWVEQHQILELVLGRDFWYQNPHPRLRAAHGVVFLKELFLDDFLQLARRLEDSMEGQIVGSRSGK